MQETRVWSLGQKDPLKKDAAPSPVFLPRRSMVRGSWQGADHGVAGWEATEYAHAHIRVSILFQILSPLRLLEYWAEFLVLYSLSCRLSVLSIIGTHSFFKYTDHLLEELNISENVCFTASSEHPALRKIEGCFSFRCKQSDPEGGGSVWRKKRACLIGLLVGPEKAGAGCLHGEPQVLKFWFCPCVIHVNKRPTESPLHVWNGGCNTRLPGRLGGLRELTSAAVSVHRLVVVQSVSRVLLFATPSMAAPQACPSFTISQSLLRLTSIVLIMPSSHLILCCPLLLLPSTFPSIRVFSNELALCIRWPKYIGASASASALPVNIQGWFPSGWTGSISLQSKRLSRVFSNTTIWNISSLALSLLYGPTLTFVHDYWQSHSFDYMMVSTLLSSLNTRGLSVKECTELSGSWAINPDQFKKRGNGYQQKPTPYIC